MRNARCTAFLLTVAFLALDGRNAYARTVQEGITTYLDLVHAQGGVHGRQVRNQAATPVREDP